MNSIQRFPASPRANGITRDSRRENRVLLFGPADIVGGNSGPSVTAEIVNMSAHGAMVRLSVPPEWLQVGSMVQLRVFGATLSAEVRHRSPSLGWVLVGFVFTDATPGAR